MQSTRRYSETLRGLLRLPLGPAIALAASFILLTGVHGESPEQATPRAYGESKTEAAAHSSGIAVTEIATRATEVANLIRGFNAQLAAGAGIKAISESLPDAAKLIDLEASMTMYLLQQRPTLVSLERQRLLWRQRQIVTTTWLSALTQRASLLQDALNHLAELEETWTATRAAAQAANPPEPILQQIEDTLTAIAAEQAPIQTQRTAVLNLQARVAKEVARCGNVLAEIDRLQQQAVAGILVRDGKPIWSDELWAGVRTGLLEHIRKVGIAFWADILEYVRDPPRECPCT